MPAIDLDPASLREWLAAVGLLRLVSETTDDGRLFWRRKHGRFELVIDGAPDDLAARCAAWINTHKSAWWFAHTNNVDFDAGFWRLHATAETATPLEVALWCAVASDAVMHRSGTKLQASTFEYAHGGGRQNWLASLRGFLSDGMTADDIGRVLAGRRNERRVGAICRWDPACERNHAYRGKAPTNDPMNQDQDLNALAAIGFASCPSAPTHRGLSTPLVAQRGLLRWPVWTAPLRLADLEAAICCAWPWPTMEARRWLSGKLYCFSRAELREPQASETLPGGSRRQQIMQS